VPHVHALTRFDEWRSQPCDPACGLIRGCQIADRAIGGVGSRAQLGHLEFLSTAGNSYDADYFGDTSKLPGPIRRAWGVKEGEVRDETMFNVFRLDNGTVRHFWGSELTWAPMESGQHHRSGDAANALWGLLDMTPEGRGEFLPKLAY
jgi:predicted dithiol-disulfide oxidoreductase (DUF899 family)